MSGFNRPLAIAILAAIAFYGVNASCSAQKAPKLKPTVTFATSWDQAVAEAKLLNLPIILHSHGFN